MKHIFNIVVFCFIIFAFPTIMIFAKDNLISKEERRYLSTYEDINNNYFDGTYSKRLDTYLLDQFPFRNDFRKIKAFANFNVFRKIENENIIIQNGYAIQLKDNYNYDGVDDCILQFNKLKHEFFNTNNAYFVLIPDKSCFCNYANSCNYNQIENIIVDNLDDIHYINTKDYIDLDMYYKTDSHWSQDKIIDYANNILKQLNNSKIEDDFDINCIENFSGIYASQAAINLNSDKIYYLSNDFLDKCIVTNFETNEVTGIYNLDKLKDEKSLDMYDIFLSGASTLLKVETPNNNGKTLYIFRDSFASSLTPFLIKDYQYVYLIDLRYMNSKYITSFIDIDNNGDVLFIYNTLLLDNKNNFKIN